MNTPFNIHLGSPMHVGCAMLLGLALGGAALQGADQPRSASRPAAAPAGKVEYKLLVNVANTKQAFQALQLDPQGAVTQLVCFFDTPDGALDARHLILRARQKGDGPGQSTVKIRVAGNASDLSVAEQTIPPEQDWLNETSATLSRSLDNDSLANGLVTKVAAGQTPVIELFDAAQRQLLAARLPDLKWESLHCFGPLDARIWRQQRRLPGFPSAVTIELWHLQQGERRLDLLEVSAKAKPKSAAQAEALAKQFYAAAKAAGLGESAGLTKTRLVMDFFQPGGRNQ